MKVIKVKKRRDTEEIVLHTLNQISAGVIWMVCSGLPEMNEPTCKTYSLLMGGSIDLDLHISAARLPPVLPRLGLTILRCDMQASPSIHQRGRRDHRGRFMETFPKLVMSGSRVASDIPTRFSP